MVRVLVTGPSGISNGLGNRLGIISNITSIIRAHEHKGDVVIQRPVVPGESLSHFNRIYAVQQTIASFSAPFALGFLYAVGNRPDAIICYDDWQAPQSFKVGDADKMIKCAWNPKLVRKYDEEGRKVEKEINEGIEILCSQNNGRKYLLPVMLQGDYNKIPANGIRVPYNPYPFMDEYRYTDAFGRNYKKRQRWIMASLQDNQRWVNSQNFKWEVLYYGVRKLGQERVEERQLAKIYASSWGVLYPPHAKLEGTGWWRVRLPMAVSAGSLVHGSPSDMSVAFGGSLFTRSEVEESSDAGNADRANEQRERFLGRVWNKEQIINFIETL